MNGLSFDQAIEFSRRWPAAYSFLLRNEIVNELAALRQETANGIVDLGRARWVADRIDGLTVFGEPSAELRGAK